MIQIFWLGQSTGETFGNVHFVQNSPNSKTDLPKAAIRSIVKIVYTNPCIAQFLFPSCTLTLMRTLQSRRNKADTIIIRFYRQKNHRSRFVGTGKSITSVPSLSAMINWRPARISVTCRSEPKVRVGVQWPRVQWPKAAEHAFPARVNGTRKLSRGRLLEPTATQNTLATEARLQHVHSRVSLPNRFPQQYFE